MSAVPNAQRALLARMQTAKRSLLRIGDAESIAQFDKRRRLLKVMAGRYPFELEIHLQCWQLETQRATFMESIAQLDKHIRLLKMMAEIDPLDLETQLQCRRLETERARFMEGEGKR